MTELKVIVIKELRAFIKYAIAEADPIYKMIGIFAIFNVLMFVAMQTKSLLWVYSFIGVNLYVYGEYKKEVVKSTKYK